MKTHNEKDPPVSQQISKLVTVIALLCVLGLSACAASDVKPPLGPGDRLRHLDAPYDMLKLNCLGLNYCEGLLDMRVNIPSYTHLDSDLNQLDAWNLQFPDDCARLLEALAWESDYSPVTRLELARRLFKGIVAAHVPGTRTQYYFRHRSGGKTYSI
jgi:hypothetical protein